MSVARDIKARITAKFESSRSAELPHTENIVVRVINARDEVQLDMAGIQLSTSRLDLIMALGVTKEDLEELGGQRHERSQEGNKQD